jgi:uncharacterized membrane protein YheB (UPF0754 family)
MEFIFIILFMVIIGAVIGGLTNSLAIKMLFRPYEPKYIGKFKIPFTPGLIPKRQAELATQMGRTVVEHLLTPEGMKRKIGNQLFYDQLNTWSQQELENIAQKDYLVQDFLAKVSPKLDTTYLETVTKEMLHKKLNHWLQENREQSIRTILPPDLIDKGEQFIEKASSYLLNQLDSYISSPEGREKIGSIAEQYLGGRGFFSSMISSFMGGDGLADKIQPAISQYLQTSEAHQMVTDLLQKEWDKWLDKDIQHLEPILIQLNVQEKLVNQVIAFISFDKLLETKISSLYEKYKEVLRNDLLPKGIHAIQKYLLDKIVDVMGRMNLQEIVKEEVERFDVKRLEEMVLGISKRELKMITYLGALLGGLIGLIQGIVVMLLR